MNYLFKIIVIVYNKFNATMKVFTELFSENQHL